MGVAVPGKAEELKHPIVLQPKCKEHFEKYLDNVQQYSSFYYSSWAYVSGSLDSHLKCNSEVFEESLGRRSISEAFSRC